MTIRDIAQKVQLWREHQASIRELSRLSDRQLADLGIRRADIDFVARTGQRQ
jgi:uncharacterized protein YjiS (DUF1127 family)